MTVRVVFFSDSHLGFDYPVRPRTERPRRGSDFFANFQRVLDHARHTAADLVVHGGDFFFRSRVDPSIIDRAYQMLLDFAASGIPIAIVPGNHERSVLPPSLFLNHPDIHVFDRPRTFRFEMAGGSVALSGFPYVRDIRSHFVRSVTACESSNIAADFRLLVLHHAVDGATVGPSDFVFRSSADVIAREQLPPEYDCVLAGHIHRHQVLDYQVPVLYCGSIERTSYAEQLEPKGFCEVALDRDAPPGFTFRELPARPMVDFDGRGHAAPSTWLPELERKAAAWPRDAIVRIRLDDYPDRQTAKVLRDMLHGPHSISVARV